SAPLDWKITRKLVHDRFQSSLDDRIVDGGGITNRFYYQDEELGGCKGLWDLFAAFLCLQKLHAGLAGLLHIFLAGRIVDVILRIKLLIFLRKTGRRCCGGGGLWNDGGGLARLGS